MSGSIQFAAGTEENGGGLFQFLNYMLSKRLVGVLTTCTATVKR